MVTKVYEIEARQPGVEARDKLGKALGAMAKRDGDTVSFHEYIAPVGGKPVILLECSEEFYKKLITVPEAKSGRTVSPWQKTQKSEALQKFYMPPPPPPKKRPRSFDI